MSAALDLFMARAPAEEGRRAFAYNDSTGERVTCRPNGNLTISIGVNLENGLDNEEIDWLLLHRASLIERALLPLNWYAGADPVRQSVFLDAAFNIGITGLTQFNEMITAARAQDWIEAAAQLLDSDAARGASGRYRNLAAILSSGTDPPPGSP